MTTLMRIFTPLVWFLVFLSVLAIVAFLKFGAYLGKKYGVRTANEEIALYPLRWMVFEYPANIKYGISIEGFR